MKLATRRRPTAAALAMVALVFACGERESVVGAVSVEGGSVDTIAEDSELATGKRLFATCALCHTTNAGVSSTVGPNLAGVLGSKAGAKSDFVYSEALISSGIVWTEEALERYIESPAAFIPGGSMGFVGVADASERQAVLAYLIDVSNAATAPSDQGEDVAIWE